MSNKKEKTVDSVIEEKQISGEFEQTLNPAHVKYAYSMIENDGKYHVISVEFDPNKLVSGKVKKIESNTDKYLMQERLQVLLMTEDLL